MSKLLNSACIGAAIAAGLSGFWIGYSLPMPAARHYTLSMISSRGESETIESGMRAIECGMRANSLQASGEGNFSCIPEFNK